MTAPPTVTEVLEKAVDLPTTGDAETMSLSEVVVVLRPFLEDAVRDGIEDGCQMAIDILRAAQASTARENQTWDSAIALLAITKADYAQARQSESPS